MNRSATLALLILSVLLLASSAQAELVINKYTNDFTLASPDNQQIKLCSCQTRVDKLVVENTGSFESSYAIAVQSAYPRKIRLAQDSFSLSPGDSREVPVYIEDSCGVQGTFAYDIAVTNSYGRTQRLSRTIRADACQVALVSVTPLDKTVSMCQDATFAATVTNVAPYAETFTLGMGGNDAFATYPRHELSLAPGESATQNVTLRFPCATYGTKDVAFMAYAGKDGLAASAHATLAIRNDFAFALNLSTGMDACAQSTTISPLLVQNQADAPDRVRLTLDGPSFVTFDGGAREKTLDLDPNASASVDLRVAPGNGSMGSHAVTVRALDLYGGVSKARDTTLSVDDCYDATLEVRTAPDIALVGADRDCCGPKTYYVNVRNAGDRTQAFQLRLDGPSIFTLDETTVTLGPSQNVNVPLRAQLPCTNDTYQATVIAYPVGEPQANASAALTVESLTRRACYMVQIDGDEVSVRDDTPLVPLIVKNVGARGGNYTIATNDTLFALRESEIELRAGEEKAVHLVPLQNLSSQEKGRYVVLPTLTLREEGIPYVESVGIQLRGKNAFERFNDWLFGLSVSGWGSCAKVSLALFAFLVVLVAVLLLTYAGKVSSVRRGMGRQALLLLRICIVALIAILGISLLFLTPPSREARFERSADGNATVLEWYQNEKFTLDLNDYFKDPDSDTLTYAASQPADISASISGATLTLTPDHNFAGEDTLVVTASDEKGGVADSPTFLLRVIPRRDLTFAQWVGVWCEYVIVALLLAILVVLLLLSFAIPQRRQDLATRNVIVVMPRDEAEAQASSARAAPSPGLARKARPRRRAKGTAKTKMSAREASPKKAKPAPRASTGSRSVRKAKATASAKAGARRGASMKAPAKRGGAPRVVAIVEPHNALARARLPEIVRVLPGDEDSPRSGRGTQQTVQNILNVPGGSGRQGETVFIGSKTGNTVHTPYCMIARRIPKNRRVAFSSKKEAMDAGLVPCKGCRPF